MPFKPPPVQPDFSSLIVSLDNSKTQVTNYSLYQTIFFLIQNTSKARDLLVTSIDTINEIISKIAATSFLTVDDETLNFPNSRQLLAGIGITFDDTIPGKRTVSATGGGGGGGGFFDSASFLEQESNEDSFSIPGPKGDKGDTGASGGGIGAPGPPGLDGEDAYEFLIPGPSGSAGASGAAGTQGFQGNPGPPGFDGEDINEFLIPGPSGNNGAVGATGSQGIQGPPGLDAEEPLEPFLIPGPQGIQGVPGGGGGGITLLDFTKDLGAANSSGTFDITGLAGLTPNKNVVIVQTMQPIASKGDARDEFEMDPIVLTGYVFDATTIRALWSTASKSPAVGTYAFAYAVSG